MTSGSVTTRYVPVVYCFDRHYSNYAAVSIFSLHANAKTPIKVYCVVPAADVAAIPAIDHLRTRHKIDIQVVSVEGTTFEGWKVSDHVTSAAYIRILIPTLIEEKKAIYVDADTIVLRDVLDLYRAPLETFLLAGIADINQGAGTSVPRIESDTYINSGVLVLNLDALRNDEFFQKCSEINSRYRDAIVWWDQDIINKYAENRKTILTPDWNRQIFANQIKLASWDEALKNSKIIHFVGTEKPWMEWCHPRISEFWWSWARRLGLESIKSIPVTHLNQTLNLIRSRDLNEEFKQSGLLKNNVISFLINQLNQRN